MNTAGMTKSFLGDSRELRDQIYAELLPKRYIVYRTYPKSYRMADSAILRVSKQLNQEAEEVMYRFAKYRYEIDFGGVLRDGPSKRQAGQMQNLEMIGGMVSWSENRRAR